MAATRVYSAGDAARALGISLDTLRRWDREGRIRVQRDRANRRVVPETEIFRLRGRGEQQQSLSARNHLRGVVESVQVEGLLARVELVIDQPAHVVAIITAEAAAELGLEPGAPAAAVVKSTSIMVER
jgi:molybdopterin-binding protein